MVVVFLITKKKVGGEVDTTDTGIGSSRPMDLFSLLNVQLGLLNPSSSTCRCRAMRNVAGPARSTLLSPLQQHN